MEYNLDILKMDLERLHEREFTWLEIARACDISTYTIYRLANNTATGTNLATLEKLRQYFIAQGLDVAPGDMFREKPPAS